MTISIIDRRTFHQEFKEIQKLDIGKPLSTIIYLYDEKSLLYSFKQHSKHITDSIEHTLNEINLYVQCVLLQNKIKANAITYVSPNLLYYDTDLYCRKSKTDKEKILRYSLTPQYSHEYQTLFIDPNYFLKHLKFPHIIKYILVHEFSHHVQNLINQYTLTNSLIDQEYYKTIELKAEYIAGYLYKQLYGTLTTNSELTSILKFIDYVDNIDERKQRSVEFKKGYTYFHMLPLFA